MSDFHIMYYICLPITFLCIFGFCRKQGVWEILIKIFCLFFATSFALALFEPLANLLDGPMLSCAYYNDMWAFLLIFGIVLAATLFITSKISKINVQLPTKQNKIIAMVLMLLLFIVFYFISAQLFYYTLPEKPDKKAVAASGEKSPSLQFQLVEYISRGSLAGQQAFQFSDFYKRQFNRRASVYDEVTNEKGGGMQAVWTFKGNSSPNTSGK